MEPKNFGLLLLKGTSGAAIENIITREGLRNNASRHRELLEQWLAEGVRSWGDLVKVFKSDPDLTTLGIDIESSIKAGLNL